MERNTLLAFVLSGLVLFLYQAIFVPPKPPKTLKNSQNIAAQNVKETSTSSLNVTQENSEKTTLHPLKEINYDIKSGNKVISYTNVGGSLHNIDFLKNNPFPITDVLKINGFDNAAFEGQKVDDKTIVLLYKGKNVQITKTYEMKDQNLLNVRMEIKNLSETSNLNNPTFTAFEIDESRMDINQNTRETALFEYSIYSHNKIFRKGSANKFSDKNNKNEEVPVNWVAFRDRYHALVIKPDFETKGYVIKADGEKQLNMTVQPTDKNIGPGGSFEYDFSVYLGPQNPWIMQTYGKGFEKVVAFSNFAIVEWIAQAIYHTMPFLHKIFKSWGVCIILMSMFIYGITYPMTYKSMLSMRKMQAVQPKMAALKERFKNDPQKLNMEMMEIYRREKINPFGGCLPLFIQMPFFMALYQILWRAQYFQGQGFLWIKDLSQPDRLIIFPFYLPLFGNELNILPILTGCIMFLQQKVTTKNMVVTDEQQVMQQKMMMYILPVMMTLMFYKFASSWAIYFLVFYILSTLTQLKIAKAASSKS